MGNVVDAMKLLGLEGRVHLEWVSASEGPKFRETVTRVRRADQGAWTQVRLGTRRNRREDNCYRGRRQVVSPSGSFVFDSADIMLRNQITNLGDQFLGDLHDRLSNIFISSFVFSDCLLLV